jgi:hypothetical protein
VKIYEVKVKLKIFNKKKGDACRLKATFQDNRHPFQRGCRFNSKNQPPNKSSPQSTGKIHFLLQLSLPQILPPPTNRRPPIPHKCFRQLATTQATRFVHLRPQGTPTAITTSDKPRIITTSDNPRPITR